MGEHISIVDTQITKPSRGTAGLPSQCSGQALTVSALSSATGGIGRGYFVERDTK